MDDDMYTARWGAPWASPASPWWQRWRWNAAAWQIKWWYFRAETAGKNVENDGTNWENDGKPVGKWWEKWEWKDAKMVRWILWMRDMNSEWNSEYGWVEHVYFCFIIGKSPINGYMMEITTLFIRNRDTTNHHSNMASWKIHYSESFDRNIIERNGDSPANHRVSSIKFFIWFQNRFSCWFYILLYSTRLNIGLSDYPSFLDGAALPTPFGNGSKYHIPLKIHA